MYDPSNVGKKGSIFGLPYNQEESDLIFLPVHLDVTVSCREGTSRAPKLILEESSQIDLSLPSIHNPWEYKMCMSDRLIKSSRNEIHRGRALNVIKALEAGKDPEIDQIEYINEFCEVTHQKIETATSSLLDLNKRVAVIGGDHSSPLGLIRALSKRQSFGILQIDAHMDLRDSYEGFTFSHASIMFNAIKETGVTSITQVGIRDFCEEEEAFIENSEKSVSVFYDENLFKDYVKGIAWDATVKKIIDTLPECVYVSFDMDGLDPALCPHTGTPVPGGLRFNETIFLLEEMVRSGKKIIGFDVCETGNHLWDANVASRIIYRLAALTGVSSGILSFK